MKVQFGNEFRTGHFPPYRKVVLVICSRCWQFCRRRCCAFVFGFVLDVKQQQARGGDVRWLLNCYVGCTDSYINVGLHLYRSVIAKWREYVYSSCLFFIVVGSL